MPAFACSPCFSSDKEDHGRSIDSNSRLVTTFPGLLHAPTAAVITSLRPLSSPYGSVELRGRSEARTRAIAIGGWVGPKLGPKNCFDVF